MDNPQKLATYGEQDEEKQNKNTTQYVLDTIIHKQTETEYVMSYIQVNLNTEIISCLCILLSTYVVA